MNGHDEFAVDGKVREITLDGVDDEYARVRNLLIVPRDDPFDESDVALRQRVAMMIDKFAIRRVSEARTRRLAKPSRFISFNLR